MVAETQSSNEALATSEQHETTEPEFEGEAEPTKIIPELGRASKEHSLSGVEETRILIGKGSNKDVFARVRGDVVNIKSATPEEDRTQQDVAITVQESRMSLEDATRLIVQTEGLTGEEAKSKTKELIDGASDLIAHTTSNADLADQLRTRLKEGIPKKKTYAVLLREKSEIPHGDTESLARVSAEILALELENFKDAPESVKATFINKADGYTPLRYEAVNLVLDKGSEWVSGRLAELKTRQDNLDTNTQEGRIEQSKMQREFAELENMLPIVERIEALQTAPLETIKLIEQAKKDFDLEKIAKVSARIDSTRSEQSKTINQIVELQKNLKEAKRGLEKIQEQIEKGTNVQESLDSQSQFVKDIRFDIKRQMQKLDFLDATEEALKRAGFDLANLKTQKPEDTDLFHLLSELPNHQTLQAVETMLSRSDIPDSTKDILRAYQNSESDRTATEHKKAIDVAATENELEAFEQEGEIVEEVSSEDVTGIVENLVVLSSSAIEELNTIHITTAEQRQKATKTGGIIDQNLEAAGIDLASRENFEVDIHGEQEVEATKATPIRERKKIQNEAPSIQETQADAKLENKNQSLTLEQKAEILKKRKAEREQSKQSKEYNRRNRKSGIQLEMIKGTNDYELKLPGYRIILGETREEAQKYFDYAMKATDEIIDDLKNQYLTTQQKVGKLAQAVMDYQDAEYAREDGLAELPTIESTKEYVGDNVYQDVEDDLEELPADTILTEKEKPFVELSESEFRALGREQQEDYSQRQFEELQKHGDINLNKKTSLQKSFDNETFFENDPFSSGVDREYKADSITSAYASEIGQDPYIVQDIQNKFNNLNPELRGNLPATWDEIVNPPEPKGFFKKLFAGNQARRKKDIFNKVKAHLEGTEAGITDASTFLERTREATKNSSKGGVK